MDLVRIERFVPIEKDLKGQQQREDAEFRKAAKLYEQQFLQEMVKAMRSTVQPSGLVKQNFAEKLFTEQLDGEYVNGWSDRGGVGMAEMIYTQLKERFGSQKTLESPPAGPIPLMKQTGDLKPLSEAPQFKMLKSPQLPNSSQFLFEGEPGSFPLTAPWSGVVEQNFALGEGVGSETSPAKGRMISIAHKDRLRSSLVFQGKALDLHPGDQVQAGDLVGLAEGGLGLISWKVTKMG